MPRPPTIIILLITMLAILAGSVVNAGLPALGGSLGDSSDRLPFVVSAYLMPLALFLPAGGVIGDLYGRTGALAVGAGLLAVASLACAAAGGIDALIRARVVQGLAAALILPNAVALIATLPDAPNARRHLAAYSAACTVATGLGPVIGVRFAADAGWRWMFAVAGIAAIALFLAILDVVPRTGHSEAIDTRGIAWRSVIASRQLSRSVQFRLLTLFTICIYGAFLGLLVLLPTALERVGGYTSELAGMALLPLTLLAALLTPLVAIVGQRFPRPALLTVSAATVGGALWWLLHARLAGDYRTQVLPALCILAFGMALSGVPLTQAVLDSAGPRRAGLACGLNSAAARLGGGIATLMLAPVFASSDANVADQVRAALLFESAVTVIAGVAATILLLLSTRRMNPLVSPLFTTA